MNYCTHCGGYQSEHEPGECPKRVKHIPNNTSAAIAEECKTVCELLQAKNVQYGDSALNPVRIMSKASPEEALLVRIDDKLSRLARGQEAGEDCVLDLIGYLILLRISRRK